MPFQKVPSLTWDKQDQSLKALSLHAGAYSETIPTTERGNQSNLQYPDILFPSLVQVKEANNPYAS